METGSYQIFDGKVILRIKDKTCANPDELLSSPMFIEILTKYLQSLARQKSKLLNIFEQPEYGKEDIKLLVRTLKFLTKLQADLLPRVVEGSAQFFRDKELFNDFVEQLYNYWRSLHRIVICDSTTDRLDKRPYRTFNDTVENLMHVVRSTYRDVQENITGRHPRIYRQVSAGAEIGTIANHQTIPFTNRVYKRLNSISVIRQVLIYPPLIFSTPMNKRTGSFERVPYNPLNGVELNPKEYLCYPAKVGSLVIMVYFSMSFSELGFSLCNLFELAHDEDLERQPDAVFVYGAPQEVIRDGVKSETIFYDDGDNNLLVGAIPYREKYAYFGYLKKMILTLHNIKMMKMGHLPYHGAMMNIKLRDKAPATVLIMGDTGAGKSESLEALRSIARDEVEDLIIIADDMGSLDLDGGGTIMGYGTEMGAFVRLDDLQSGYAWGQTDRTIIMNADQVNARVVIPVTKFDDVIRGYPVDYVFYANNYDQVDADHPVIDRFKSAGDALPVFRDGKVMSKGTTTTTGLVGTYFANIFGPPQYSDLHEPLAEKFFERFFEQGTFVGQIRTQLGVEGMEHSGPEEAARMLLDAIRTHSPSTVQEPSELR